VDVKLAGGEGSLLTGHVSEFDSEFASFSMH
jgi:hypothetical protein